MNPLNTWAEEALLQTKGDRKAAVAIIHSMLTRDETLFKSLLDKLIVQECWQYVDKAAYKSRQPMLIQNPDNPAGLKLMAQRHIAGILNTWFISSGKSLGEATLQDVLGEMELHRSLANANAKRATFYGLIAERMDGHATVKDAIGDNDVLTMLAQVNGTLVTAVDAGAGAGATVS